MSEEKIIENEVVETENKAAEETTETKEEVVTMTEEEKNNENLSIYNKVRVVPDSAKREIQGGKLKGFTDINPMWRIKTLTEVFGVCGFGWKVNIIEKWLEAGAKNEIIVNVRVNLFVKIGDNWSEAIEGIGGACLVATEKGTLTTNDEAFKMAYTDAISVACKSLGIGADVYYAKDSSKYNTTPTSENKGQNTPPPQEKKPVAQSKYNQAKAKAEEKGFTMAQVTAWIKKKYGKAIAVNSLTDEQFDELTAALENGSHE